MRCQACDHHFKRSDWVWDEERKEFDSLCARCRELVFLALKEEDDEQEGTVSDTESGEEAHE